MSRRKCAAMNCTSNKRTNPSLRFFQFPTDSIRYDLWCKIAQIPESGHRPYRFLCEHHFSSQQFRAKGLVFKENPRFPTGPLNPVSGNYAPSVGPSDSGHVAQDDLPYNQDVSPSFSSSIEKCSPIPHTPVFSSSFSYSSFSSTPVLSTPVSSLSLPSSSSNHVNTSCNSIPYSSFSDLDDLSYLHIPSCSYSEPTPKPGLDTPRRKPLNPRMSRIPLRLINASRMSEISPRKRKLVKFLGSLLRSNKRLKSQLKLAKALRLKNLLGKGLDSYEFNREIGSFMSASALDLFKSQVLCTNKDPRGRRWSVDVKVMAASLYKKSPLAYRALRSLICLPSPRTVISFINQVPFHPGINIHIFNSLKNSLAKMGKSAPYCSLIFDEMSIMECLQYDWFTDKVIGHEDLGMLGRFKNMSRQVLVFMAQGLLKKWKQPVAFYFVGSRMNAETLVAIIREVLTACFTANLKVQTTICDMSATNVRALDILGSTEAHPVFSHEGNQIVTIFDPPHLLKCTRNMFYKYNISVPIEMSTVENDTDSCRMVASWDHIRKCYQLDLPTLTGVRILRKISEQHIDPNFQQKMKVKYAAQVFSASVAGLLDNYVRAGELPAATIATISVVKTMDNLFDTFNGSGLKLRGFEGLRSSVTLDNVEERIQFWDHCKEKINGWRFIRPSKDLGGCETMFKPPSQSGWIRSINGIKAVWTNLVQQFPAIYYLETRRINQDPLENLFGLIRSQCGSCQNPSATMFISAFKTAIINGLAFKHQRNTNCEPDDSEALDELKAFLKAPQNDSEDTQLYVPPDVTQTEMDITFCLSKIPRNISISEGMAIEYVSGFVAKHVLKDSTCTDCKAVLCNEHPSSILNLISEKEYFHYQRLLTYPSERLITTVTAGCLLFQRIIPNISHSERLSKQITSVLLSEVDLSWLQNACDIHYSQNCDKLLYSICRIMLPWWCKQKNLKLKAKSKYSSRRKLNILSHI